MNSHGTKSPEPDDVDLAFQAITDELQDLDLDYDTDDDQHGHDATTTVDPQPSQDPASCLGPAPTPAPASIQAPAPPAPSWEPPPPPPELIVPPKPQRTDDGLVNWWAKAFPNIVWLSVFAGLSGQVFGFAEFFGGTKIAWLIALVLGGTFEFMMVACSSRGLRAIGLGRAWTEFIPFLLLGTAAAGFAAYMNLNHFDGWLGLAAATISGLGYTAHVSAHLFDELEHRAALKAWQEQKDEIEAEIKARADAERAEYDRYLSQLAKQRDRELTSVAPPEPPKGPKASTAATPKATAKATTGKTPSKPGGRIGKAEAIRIGVAQKASTAGQLRDAIRSAGYKLPASSSTLDNWCKEIKHELGLPQQNRP